MRFRFRDRACVEKDYSWLQHSLACPPCGQDARFRSGVKGIVDGGDTAIKAAERDNAPSGSGRAGEASLG